MLLFAMTTMFPIYLKKIYINIYSNADFLLIKDVVLKIFNI